MRYDKDLTRLWPTPWSAKLLGRRCGDGGRWQPSLVAAWQLACVSRVPERQSGFHVPADVLEQGPI